MYAKTLIKSTKLCIFTQVAYKHFTFFFKLQQFKVKEDMVLKITLILKPSIAFLIHSEKITFSKMYKNIFYYIGLIAYLISISKTFIKIIQTTYVNQNYIFALTFNANIMQSKICIVKVIFVKLWPVY